MNNNISRRVAQLEGSREAGVTRYAWQPDDLATDQEAAWLADLRAENGWGEGDDVVLYRWAGRNAQPERPRAPPLGCDGVRGYAIERAG